MLRFLRGATHHTKTIWWVIIFLTVASFLLGFVFLLGSGLGNGPNARRSGVVGSVNGQRITVDEYQIAINNQSSAYKQQYGVEPQDRDQDMVKVQAWRGLVMERLMSDEAKRLGIPAHDKEVVLTLESSPPPEFINSPGLQTNGKFDPAKYQQALRDPNNNIWGPFEERTRQQLPVRKLQERLMSSIKLSQPELMDLFHDRYDKANVTIVQVPAAPDSAVAAPTEADIDRAFQEQKGRFMSDDRVQLEVLVQPKKLGEEEKRSAHELAQSLVNRARAGEDFASLARDYSEEPNAAKGGVVDRWLQPAELGPEMGPTIAALNVGQVSDAFQDGTRFIAVKVMEKTPPAPPAGPAIKIAQLVIKIRPDDATVQDQYTQFRKLRDRASRIGLGRAAAERGLPTQRTEWFDLNGSPQALYGLPEAVDWALHAKLNEVSQVFVGGDELGVVQVAAKRPAGPAPREEITDPLRQLARLDARVAKSKPKADAVASAIAGGATLDAAARSAGLTSYKIESLTRDRPDPRLGGAPEFVGALFRAPAGKVVGPVRGMNGWYFGRLEAFTPADTSQFMTMRTNLTTEVLQRRQQTFMIGYLTGVRSKAKVEDQRASLQGN
jgi:peptidyl-prolyl cis-trans isomerase D